jgi:phosphohistidine phosphatase
MRLFLVRHGQAEDKPGKEDAARALTAQGRSDIAAIAPLLASGLERPLRLLSSPYLRAEQTAEILRERLAIPEKLAATQALLPESDWSALRPLLEEFATEGVRCLIAVGHNPSISQMCGRIAGGSDEVRIALSKGAVACLLVDDLQGRPAGELLWLVTPSVLRATTGK